MLAKLFLLAALIGCGAYDSAKSGAKKVGGLIAGSAVEYTLCPLGLLDCGHVYVCDTAAANELGQVEICVDDDEAGLLEMAEAQYGDCEPTPRHQGICVDLCNMESPLPDGRGSNALNGSYCGGES